jgi:hypothetical protein
MPVGEEEFREKPKSRLPCVPDDNRERRLAARQYYRAAPPYCIRGEDNGSFTLRRKRYEYFEERAPEEATSYRVISSHDDMEEAERRLRLIVGSTVYYDAEGRPTKAPKAAKSHWDMPPTDAE